MGRQAEPCNKHLTKGQRVLVVGEMEEARTYTDRDGNTRASIDVRARNVEFLTPRAETPIAFAVIEPFLIVESRLLLRRGPGINHAVLTTVEAGEQLEVIGRNLDSTWWQVIHADKPAWVQSLYVTTKNVDSIQIVATPTLLPSPKKQPTPIQPPTPTQEVITEELWEQLQEMVRQDVEESGVGGELSAQDVKNYATDYFVILMQLTVKCQMTLEMVLSLIEFKAQRIEEVNAFKEEKYWARWTLLNVLKEYTPPESGDPECFSILFDYIEDYGDKG